MSAKRNARQVRTLAKTLVWTAAWLGLTWSMAASPVRAAPAPAPTRPSAPSTPGGRAVAVPIFKEGIKLFDAGYYQKALDKFQLALFHFPSAKIHTRIALCFKWLGKYVQAIGHYELFLQKTKPAQPADPKAPPTPTANLRRAVQATVTELLKKIGQLQLQVTAPKGALVRLNGGIVGKAPLTKLLRLSPGKYHVTVSAKDHHPVERDLQLGANQLKRVAIKLKAIQKKLRGGGAAADDI